MPLHYKHTRTKRNLSFLRKEDVETTIIPLKRLEPPRCLSRSLLRRQTKSYSTRKNRSLADTRRGRDYLSLAH
jgi:hypothetical protein